MRSKLRRTVSTLFVFAGVLLFALSACGQTNTPAKTEPKSASPPETANHGQTQGASAQGGVEILSDTMGVDFGPYLSRVVQNVRQNWYNLIPGVVRPPIKKKGKLAIEFAIMKDGSVAGMRLVATSGDVAMDRAAWGGITTSVPFPPLPEEFKGQYIALRLYFYYNPDRSDVPSNANRPFGISPPGPVNVSTGSTFQFSANIRSIENSAIIWTLDGPACANSDCGSISLIGLYTAPTKAPDPPEITVTATETSAPSKSASTTVTIVRMSTGSQKSEK